MEDQSNLGPGTYSLSVSDQNGCYALTDVVITEPQELIISSSISDYSGYNVSCNSESNGWIDIDVSGGDGEYTYAWIGLDGTFFSVNDDIQNLSVGEYTLTVTDERNCSTSALIEITESPEMTISEVPPIIRDMEFLVMERPMALLILQLREERVSTHMSGQMVLSQKIYQI